jgi:uracil-DNA glycosylase
MIGLPESVLRWARCQRELGVDEVVLDERWAPPAPAAAVPRSSAVRAAPEVPVPQRTGIRAAPVPGARAPVGAPALPATGTRKAPDRVVPAAAPASRAASTAPLRSAIPVFANIQELSDHAKACTRCVLHGRRKSVLAAGGPDRSTWAVLTLYAWGEDSSRGEILAGDYALPFLDLVRESGLPAPAAASIFACTPDNPSDTTIQGFTEAVRCRGHWSQRIKLSGARAVLVLDHRATTLAQGPASSVDWPAFRGQVWDLDGLPAVSTHHPSRLARQESLRPEVKADLDRIRSLIGEA